jgi:hypothetical protein
MAFGTPIWDPDLRPPFGTPIWDPDLGHPHLGHPHLGPRFGTPIWDPDLGPRLGPRFGTPIWDPDLERTFRTPILELMPNVISKIKQNSRYRTPSAHNGELGVYTMSPEVRQLCNYLGNCAIT